MFNSSPLTKSLRLFPRYTDYRIIPISIVPIKKFVVESDARVALEGAFSGNPGSILIAGTGSIMFGKDSKGNIHRVGGFGRILGDEGSGFHIARSGLTAVAKQFDGRGERTRRRSARGLDTRGPQRLCPDR